MKSHPASPLDSPDRIDEIRRLIRTKGALQAFYFELYQRYKECILASPDQGIVLELGSGGGFTKEVIPEVVTSDIIPYSGVDQVVDATRMPFPDKSLRTILMTNVFHHIPDVRKFFEEATRCLNSGGRILIVDHHRGFLSSFLLKFIHHENFNPEAKDWSFTSHGPLSDSNTALAGIVFGRDRAIFEHQFPALRIVKITPHTPLFYWLAGGLKSWSLIPGHSWCIRVFRTLDRWILSLSGNSAASFTNIELRRE